MDRETNERVQTDGQTKIQATHRKQTEKQSGHPQTNERKHTNTETHELYKQERTTKRGSKEHIICYWAILACGTGGCFYSTSGAYTARKTNTTFVNGVDRVSPLHRNIEEVVKFPGLPQHKQLTYAAKQMIAREVFPGTRIHSSMLATIGIGGIHDVLFLVCCGVVFCCWSFWRWWCAWLCGLWLCVWYDVWYMIMDCVVVAWAVLVFMVFGWWCCSWRW